MKHHTHCTAVLRHFLECWMERNFILHTWTPCSVNYQESCFTMVTWIISMHLKKLLPKAATSTFTTATKLRLDTGEPTTPFCFETTHLKFSTPTTLNFLYF